MKVEHWKIHDDYKVPDNTVLYRYMSLDQFIALAETGELILRRVVDWIDPNEAHEVRRNNRNFQNQLRDIQSANNAKDDDSYMRRSKYMDDACMNFIERAIGICFSEENESYALWQLFSGSDSGVMIEMDASVLKNRFFESDVDCSLYCLGKIKYQKLKSSREEPTEQSTIRMELMLVKGEAFGYEKEVRLLALMNTPQKKDSIQRLSLKAGDIKSLTIHPNAKEWNVAAIKSYAMKSSIFKGVTTKKSLLMTKIES